MEWGWEKGHGLGGGMELGGSGAGVAMERGGSGAGNGMELVMEWGWGSCSW